MNNALKSNLAEAADAIEQQDWNQYRPILVSLAEALISSSLRSHVESSDLVQQTLLEAHQSADQLARLDPSARFAWLRVALRNNLLDSVKRVYAKKNDVRLKVRVSELENSFIRLNELFAIDETSPSQQLVRTEELARMLATIQDLPENQRKAIVLKHLQGLSLRAVAESLKVSEPAAAGLLHRARVQLARRMENPND